MKVPVRVVEIPWWNRGITWFIAGLFLLAAIYGFTKPDHSKADTSKSVERNERIEKVVPPAPKIIPETPKSVSVSVPASATVHTNNGTVNVNGGSATVGVNNGTVNVGCMFQTPPPRVERVRETLVVEKPVYVKVEVEKPVYVDRVVERIVEKETPPKPLPKVKEKPKPLDPCDQGQREHEARVARWRQFGR